MRLRDHCKSALALVIVVAFLLASCSTTKELSRRTINVEREMVLEKPELFTPELMITRDGQSIKIEVSRRGIAIIKETNIDEIDVEEVSLKQPALEAVGLIAGTVFFLISIPRIIEIQEAFEKRDPLYVDVRNYKKTDRGEERTLKEEITVPEKVIPLTITVNEYEKIIKTDQDGKAELDLLPIINKFGTMPNQLKVRCLAKIKDKSVLEELVIPENEIQKIVQSETGHPKLAANPVASIKFEKSEGILQPGIADKLIVTVTNHGQGEAYQLKGTIICPDPILDRKEVVFGRLDPGKTKKAFVPFEIPKEYPPKTLPVEVHFSEYNKYTPSPVETSLNIIP